jgi:hypothetical protein
MQLASGNPYTVIRECWVAEASSRGYAEATGGLAE